MGAVAENVSRLDRLLNRNVAVVNKDGKPLTANEKRCRTWLNFLPFLFAIILIPETWSALFLAFSSGGNDIIGHVQMAYSPPMTPVYFGSYFACCYSVWLWPSLFPGTHQSGADLILNTRVVSVGQNAYPRSYSARVSDCLRLALLVIASSIGWIIAGWLIHNGRDRPLDPRAAAFFHDETIDPAADGFADLTGLFAPADTQDLHAYGRNAIASGDNYRASPDAIHFSGDSTQICVTQEQVRAGKCLTHQRLASLAASNRLLLKRYRALYQRTDLTFSLGNRFLTPGLKAQDLLNLQRLIAGLWLAEARKGNGDSALADWTANMTFLRRVASGKIGIVDHAFWMIAYTDDLDILPLILASDSKLLSKHNRQVIAFLAYDYLGSWNLPQTMNATFNWLNNFASSPQSVTYHINDTQNRAYDVATTMVNLSRQRPSDIMRGMSMLKDKYDCPTVFSCMDYNVAGRMMIVGDLMGDTLLISAIGETAKQRALILWMQAKSFHISKGDMAAFLAKAPSNLQNPLTGQSFSWNAEHASILWQQNGAPRELFY